MSSLSTFLFNITIGASRLPRFDVTISDPLQKKYLDLAMTEADAGAEEALDRKSLKFLGLWAFTLCHWLLEVLPIPCIRQSGSGPKWKVPTVGTPGYLIRRNFY